MCAIRDCAIHMAWQAQERRTTPSRHGNRGTKGRILMSTERRKLLEERLAPLAPTYLEIIDESHLHAGHAGSKGGASHFRLMIWTEQFEGLTTLARDRKSTRLNSSH